MDFIKKAKDLGLDEILFSLHSIDDEHDKIVGIKGAFKKIVQAIENANKLDIYVRLNSTITNSNAKYIDNQYLNILKNFDYKTINFLPLNYFSDGKNNEKFNYNNLKYIKNFILKTNFKSLKDFYKSKNFKNSLEVLQNIKEPLIAIRYVPYCAFNLLNGNILPNMANNGDIQQTCNTLPNSSQSSQTCNTLPNMQNYIFSYYDHLYDLLDWNLCWYEYKDISDYKNIITRARLEYYKKPKNRCFKCKYFNICDGIEKNLHF